MSRFIAPTVLLSAFALTGCDTTDDEGGPSIAGRWSGVIEMSGESFGGPFTLELQQDGTAATGTALWNVAGDDPAARGTVARTAPPSGAIPPTVDFLQNGSVAGIQRHDVRLDDETLSGTWVFTTSNEFSVGTVVLTRR